VQIPTGGKAHEPQGMIRCDSEADSTVWMKEDKSAQMCVSYIRSEMILSFQSFLFSDTYLQIYLNILTLVNALNDLWFKAFYFFRRCVIER